MGNFMKILYLYAEVMGYTLATIRELKLRYNAEIHVVHWDARKLTPFEHGIDYARFYARSTLSLGSLKKLALQIQPDLVVVSGWVDKEYMRVARLQRKRGIPVVVGFDDQWFGTPRQRIASLFNFALRRYFSHAWVSGPYQFEYASRFGFRKDEIIFNLLSADLVLFNEVYEKSKVQKKNQYPHRFLFAGRFEKVKGLDLLIEAWNALGSERLDWELHFIGNGSMALYLKDQPGITVHNFMQPERLRDEIPITGCFVLPSRSEPWGVVLHEFTAAGLPILCSDCCGAATNFLIDGLNGYRFKTNDSQSLGQQMRRIIRLDDSELYRMSLYSHQLGQHITPSLSAASLVSILKPNDEKDYEQGARDKCSIKYRVI